MSETYHINVYKKIPFKWVMRKKGHYNRSGIEIADTNTLGTLVPYVGEPYTPLSTSYTLETGYPLVINVGSGELPDYNYTSSFAGTLKSIGQTDSVPRTSYTNYNRVGTIAADIDTGIVSGFSSNKYITTTGIDLTAANTWEVVAKFKINTLGKYQFWWYLPGAWGLDDSNRMHYWSVPGGSDIYSSYTFVADSWYWVKMEFTGTAYNWYYKTSVDNPWTLIMSASSTTKIGSIPDLTYIGINPNTTSEYFYGDIDLSEYYVKADGIVVWSPLETITKLYNNYTKVGSISSNIATGEISNFSSDNYAKLPTAFNPGTSTWECKFKVKTGNDVVTSGKIFTSRKADNSTFSDRFGIGVAVSNSKFNFFASASGTSWLFDLFGTHTLLTNTIYWVKFGWDGTDYYLEYSTDGTTYIRDITYTSSSNLCNMAVSYLGIYRGDSFGTSWLGTIDLSNSNIVVNNEVWWSTESYQELFYSKGLLQSGVIDDGSAQTWNLFYNDGEFVADTVDIKSGYSWCGSITVPAHSM